MHTTRFAPSPTGLLHLGHAFAALTAFQAAQGARFVLRIEDLDLSRARNDYAAAICEDLAWLGLSWQQPLLRQSRRGAAYQQALALLAARGLIYPCFCTRSEIAAEIVGALDAPHRADPGVYPGTCRGVATAEREQRMACGEPFAMRLDAARASAETAALSFTESGIGPNGEHGIIAVKPTLFGDIVLARKDVPAAYHLAVVLDDAFQGITLVTRGNDLFGATHVQRLLQALLGLPAPLYAHHRLILGADGRKLSKRNQPATLRGLRAQGTSPDEIRRRLGLAPSSQA